MEDKIGQLNEDVISVILSYLTLKEARRTSVLSRRWKNMWALTTRFSFDASERMDQLRHSFDSINQEGYKSAVESEQVEYIRWVNEHVDNHRGTHLDEFVVVSHLDGRHSIDLDKWIRFAVKKRAKAIKIDLRGNGYRYSLIKNVAVLPGIECLSSLDLNYVDVTGEMIEHLLSACPLLERLWLTCTNSFNLRIVGPSLKLKHLGIRHIQDFANIEICAPNLVSLDLRTGATRVRLEGLRGLRDLYVCSRGLNDEVFRYFRQLETLKLWIGTNYSVLAPIALGPQLTNLKQLTMTIFSEQSDMSGLTNFINMCPLLRKFTLDMIDELDEEPEREEIHWGNLDPHKYLKVVEIIGFIGYRHQIRIVKYFLKGFKSLEKLIIDTHCSYLEHEEKLLAVAPGSREKAEELRSEVRTSVELMIL